MGRLSTTECTYLPTSKALLRCEPDSPSVSEKNMVKEFLPSGRASKPKHDGKWVGGTQL